jgi:hypothetical protein
MTGRQYNPAIDAELRSPREWGFPGRIVLCLVTAVLCVMLCVTGVPRHFRTVPGEGDRPTVTTEQTEHQGWVYGGSYRIKAARDKGTGGMAGNGGSVTVTAGSGGETGTYWRLK